MSKLTVVLRQLVRHDNKGREFFRGRTHGFIKEYGRSWCGKGWNRERWQRTEWFVTSNSHAVDCITCLNRYRKWQAKQVGVKLIRGETAKTMTYVKEARVETNEGHEGPSASLALRDVVLEVEVRDAGFRAGRRRSHSSADRIQSC